MNQSVNQSRRSILSLQAGFFFVTSESKRKILQLQAAVFLFSFFPSLPRQCARYGSSSNSGAPSGSQDSEQPQGLGHAEDAVEHENMKAVLRTSIGSGDKEASGVPGLRTRTRSRPGRGGEDDRKFLAEKGHSNLKGCLSLCHSAPRVQVAACRHGRHPQRTLRSVGTTPQTRSWSV